jgi:hypothetical protein
MDPRETPEFVHALNNFIDEQPVEFKEQFIEYMTKESFENKCNHIGYDCKEVAATATLETDRTTNHEADDDNHGKERSEEEVPVKKRRRVGKIQKKDKATNERRGLPQRSGRMTTKEEDMKMREEGDRQRRESCRLEEQGVDSIVARQYSSEWNRMMHNRYGVDSSVQVNTPLSRLLPADYRE